MISCYLKCLDYPRTLLVFVALLFLLALSFWPRFTFEASSDTLVVEGDPDLAYYQEMEKRFGGEEMLFLTYTPRNQPLLSTEVLAEIAEIQNRLAALENVSSVFSILDAPLLDNGSNDAIDDTAQYLTLRSDQVDFERAGKELVNSPLYANLLISRDGQTTALRLGLRFETELETLREQREKLHSDAHAGSAALSDIEDRYAAEKLSYAEQRAQLIANVRAIKDGYEGSAQLHLAGVPMIAADMIAYVKSDVMVFGVLVTLVILVMLYIFFRRPRWVLLPLLSSFLTIALLIGWLGLIRQPITVVSSNALALLAIFSLSFTIHLVVRYRELLATRPELSHAELVASTMRSKFAPSVYTALTTIVAFASLSSSHILPVEDFGWMMCIGIAIALLVALTFFPASLLLLSRGEASRTLGKPLAINRVFSRWAQHRAGRILVFSVTLIAVTAFGLFQVSLDNRFIDYFKSDTEIRAGMKYFDEHLGGTVPFEVIVAFDPYESEALDEDDAFYFEDEDAFPEKYWFTPDKIKKLRALHHYLEQLPQTGKVISLATLDQVARDHNDGKALDAVQLAVVLGALPATIREQMIDPYADPYSGEMRLSGRIMESGPYFSREKMVADIRQEAQQIGFAEGEVQVTGMMVLFNNMLKQLFNSQTSTLAYVLLATFVMFALLLRSLNLALIGLLPNVIAAATVIAFMGYAAIPLDMMTITIAAISIGIGVDDAIHYLHRFREEYAVTGDVLEAVNRSHESIGRAMYFTSITIIAGFSVLAFSNFVPTIYFGLLTALAMLFAMLANLTILPALLVLHPLYRVKSAKAG
ncbi:MAG: MMPL family transporter [Pseudomonadales bacterium]